MRKTLIWIGLIAGAVPLAFVFFALFTQVLHFDEKISITELALLSATVFLALYIPLALETFREKRKYAQEMLIEHIRSLVAGLQAVNDYLRDSADVTPSPDAKCMRVRTGFTTANLKMARLANRLPIECGANCVEHLTQFRAAYDRYFHAVTGGGLYGSGLVTWTLWQHQEFAFVALRDAEVDLVRFVNDHGLR
jgi:hypothetical protein